MAALAVGAVSFRFLLRAVSLPVTIPAYDALGRIFAVVSLMIIPLLAIPALEDQFLLHILFFAGL